MHEVMAQGFVFPNELHVAWSIMIVLYPYITGLVAGAFIVSSLYHVFGDKDLKVFYLLLHDPTALSSGSTLSLFQYYVYP
jgi:Ni/Fe-hydrogenase subunit HybB-like protein